jgi:hypothetical protein
MRHPELGAGHWPFVIALLFALVFGGLWYSEQDKVEGLNNTISTLRQDQRTLYDKGGELFELLASVDQVVGYHTERSKTADGTPFGKGSIVISDPERIRQELNATLDIPSGEGTRPSYMKALTAAATVAYDQDAYTVEAPQGEKKQVEWKTVTPAFLDKQRQVEELRGQLVARPTPPADPDDHDKVAEYQARLQAYESALKAYNDSLQELMGMEGWKEWSETIHGPGRIADAARRKIEVQYLVGRTDGYVTLENALAVLPPIIDRIRKDLKSLVELHSGTIDGLRADTTSKEETINTLQANLANTEQARTTEVGQYQNQLAEMNSRLEQANQARQTAENELAKARDDFGTTVATKDREIEARKEQARLFKAKRDLVIARDDPDGSVLAANPTLGTGTIDLGHADKAYVGQKFTVSALDRGGNRVDKGQVMVLRVTGPHASQVRIVSGQATGGDRLHNPLYQRGERIHVYFAGPLDKWPRQMAADRLAPLNVVVQTAIDGDTDYVIVPNSWTVTKEEAGGEEDGGGEGEATANPYEEAQKNARAVGATVISERVLDAFLDY